MRERWASLLLLLMLANYSYAEKVRPVALHAQKISTAEEQQLRAVLCVNSDFECHGQFGESALKFVRAEKNGETVWYVVSNSGMQLAQIHEANVGYQIDHLWSADSFKFSGGNSDNANEIDHPKISIYPALYPISQSQYAIAIVQSRIDSHPRGGAEWSNADFVVLQNDKGHLDSADRIFAAVPFFCVNQPTPGCPNDGSCEKWTIGKSRGFLTLTFEKSSRTNWYDWLATWHQSNTSEDPNGRGKTEQSKHTVELKVNDPKRDTKIAELASDFCD